MNYITHAEILLFQGVISTFYADYNITCPGASPVLTKLQRFPVVNATPVNILEMINNVDKFATFLLEDEQGTILKNIHHDKSKRQDIVREVFQRWLSGIGKKPVTWETLILTFKYSDENRLADIINITSIVSCT